MQLQNQMLTLAAFTKSIFVSQAICLKSLSFITDGFCLDWRFKDIKGFLDMTKIIAVGSPSLSLVIVNDCGWRVHKYIVSSHGTVCSGEMCHTLTFVVFREMQRRTNDIYYKIIKAKKKYWNLPPDRKTELQTINQTCHSLAFIWGERGVIHDLFTSSPLILSHTSMLRNVEFQERQ